MSVAHEASNEHSHGIPDDGYALRAVADLRGIPVEDASGLSVGSLFGALAETGTGLLRYLDLHLDSHHSHVLVPIGHVRVRTMPGGAAPHIRLRAALLEDLQQVPPVPPDVGHIDDPYERELLAAYGRTFHGERYYAHPAYDHSGVYVGDHPVVPESDANETPLTHLAYMRGWRVAEGESDIRRWRLVTSGGDDVVVRDLIVDPAASTVRYVVLELPDGEARLLPIGYVGVDSQRELVTAGGISLEELRSLPPHDGGGVHRDDEELLMIALRSLPTGPKKYLMPDYRA